LIQNNIKTAVAQALGKRADALLLLVVGLAIADEDF